MVNGFRYGFFPLRVCCRLQPLKCAGVLLPVTVKRKGFYFRGAVSLLIKSNTKHALCYGVLFFSRSLEPLLSFRGIARASNTLGVQKQIILLKEKRTYL